MIPHCNRIPNRECNVRLKSRRWCWCILKAAGVCRAGNNGGAVGVLHNAAQQEASAAAALQEYGYTVEDAVAAMHSCAGDPHAALELLHGRLVGGCQVHRPLCLFGYGSVTRCPIKHHQQVPALGKDLHSCPLSEHATSCKVVLTLPVTWWARGGGGRAGWSKRMWRRTGLGGGAAGA